MKSLTIKEFSKIINVSISTISRAFNDRYDIHPDTKKMILDKAKELGYTPNPIAQQLIKHQSRMIGVVVPEFLNAFFPKVIMGIQSVMEEAGYQVLIMSSNESAQKELENVKALERNRIDGLIISLTKETRDISYFKYLQSRNVPIVQFNRVNHKLQTPKILFDDYKWAFNATEHLVEEGYKDIYHFSGPNNLILSHSRSKGYKDAMKKHGLSYEGKIIESGIFMEDGLRTAEVLLNKNIVPEAVFCFNDPVAIGAMEYFVDKGYKIPHNISFVGFTESRIAMHMNPALTSVEQPSTEIGETAGNMILHMLKNNIVLDDRVIVLDGKLNVRSSSVKH